MTNQTRTDAISDDDEPTQVYRAPEISDDTIAALRELAMEEGDVRVAELASEALAPSMQLTAEAARRHRRETRERCAQEFSLRAARAGILLALVLAAAACGVVEPDALGTSVVVHVQEVAPSAPPPAPPRLAIEVGGRQLAAVEVAFYAAPRVRVLAVEEDGTTSDVTEQATIETSDPLAVRVAGPGRLEAPPARGSATITATLAAMPGRSRARRAS